MSKTAAKTLTSKNLGDAAEHYALSQFAFAGMPGTKMPDNWKGYDLAVETGDGLQRVSVKLRSESPRWEAASWFLFDERTACDWIVFIFRQKSGGLRSWIIPFAVAKANANNPGPDRKDSWMRDITFAKLVAEPLCLYEGNWEMQRTFSPTS
jgi:hypothetical protein